MRHARPSWQTVALFGAGGFLAGVLLVAVLGGAKGIVHTTTKRVTVTVAATPRVPNVVGDRLDIAIQRLDRAGLAHELSGGGAFGVIDESNWVVVASEPPGAATVTPGVKVTLAIARG